MCKKSIWSIKVTSADLGISSHRADKQTIVIQFLVSRTQTDEFWVTLCFNHILKALTLLHHHTDICNCQRHLKMEPS